MTDSDQHHPDHIKKLMKRYNHDDLTVIRDWIDERLTSDTPGEQPGTTGPDPSADSEKKKYIAQHGSNPIAQETAQSVPEPESDEVKDLQNRKAREEHDAKAQEDIAQAVEQRQHEKLK